MGYKLTQPRWINPGEPVFADITNRPIQDLYQNFLNHLTFFYDPSGTDYTRFPSADVNFTIPENTLCLANNIDSVNYIEDETGQEIKNVQFYIYQGGAWNLFKSLDLTKIPKNTYFWSTQKLKCNTFYIGGFQSRAKQEVVLANIIDSNSVQVLPNHKCVIPTLETLKAQIQDINVSSGTLENCTLTNSSLDNSSIANSTINNTTLINCTLENPETNTLSTQSLNVDSNANCKSLHTSTLQVDSNATIQLASIENANISQIQGTECTYDTGTFRVLNVTETFNGPAITTDNISSGIIAGETLTADSAVIDSLTTQTLTVESNATIASLSGTSIEAKNLTITTNAQIDTINSTTINASNILANTLSTHSLNVDLNAQFDAIDATALDADNIIANIASIHSLTVDSNSQFNVVNTTSLNANNASVNTLHTTSLKVDSNSQFNAINSTKIETGNILANAINIHSLSVDSNATFKSLSATNLNADTVHVSNDIETDTLTVSTSASIQDATVDTLQVSTNAQIKQSSITTLSAANATIDNIDATDIDTQTITVTNLNASSFNYPNFINNFSAIFTTDTNGKVLLNVESPLIYTDTGISLDLAEVEKYLVADATHTLGDKVIHVKDATIIVDSSSVTEITDTSSGTVYYTATYTIDASVTVDGYELVNYMLEQILATGLNQLDGIVINKDVAKKQIQIILTLPSIPSKQLALGYSIYAIMRPTLT